MIGVDPPGDVYAHVAGIDLVRDEHGEYLVLEDNLRSPSGVCYMLENRQAMKRDVRAALRALRRAADRALPAGAARHAARRRAPAAATTRPSCCSRPASTTPRTSSTPSSRGRWASSSSRAATSSCHDDRRLHADDAGPAARRRDLPPHRRRFPRPARLPPGLACSASPGLINAYRAGNVALANAPGTGVADDKVVYPYVPEMIRYYLGEEPILANVPTYLGADEEIARYILEHLDELVVKAVDDSGRLRDADRPGRDRERSATSSAGGSRPTRATTSRSRRSRCRRHADLRRRRCGRAHVDLRPFVLCGEPRHERRARRAHARRAARGLARRQLVAGRRQQGHLGAASSLMLSRVAESLYWMGRYIERAEDTSRLLARQLPRRCSTPTCRTAVARGAS